MSRDEQGQTSIDFAIAMGIFLIVLTTTVAFMPTMTQPFTGGQENPLLSDRLATQLVDGHLGDPSTPSKLDPDCTWEFFNGAPDDCSAFEADGDVQTKLGIDSSVQVNVTLRNTTGGSTLDHVCAPEGATGVTDPPCSGSEILMVAGPAPPSGSGSITMARRYAVLGDDSVYVVVKVWS